MQRRRERRYQVRESVVLTVLNVGQECRRPATLVDISRSGYRVLSGFNLKVGTEVLITINSVAVFGSVRHCEREGEDSFTAGVQITTVSSEEDHPYSVDSAVIRQPANAARFMT
jgi:hypothetical protein